MHTCIIKTLLHEPKLNSWTTKLKCYTEKIFHPKFWIFHTSLFCRLIISEDLTLSPISFLTRFHSRNVPRANDVLTVRYLTLFSGRHSVHSVMQRDNASCRWRSSIRQGHAACEMDTSDRPNLAIAMRSVGPTAANTLHELPWRDFWCKCGTACLTERTADFVAAYSSCLQYVSAFQIPRLQELSVLYLKTPSISKIILFKFSFSLSGKQWGVIWLGDCGEGGRHFLVCVCRCLLFHPRPVSAASYSSGGDCTVTVVMNTTIHWLNWNTVHLQHSSNCTITISDTNYRVWSFRGLISAGLSQAANNCLSRGRARIARGTPLSAYC
jgi:hypothetical protein